jgi:hypothetical protein
MHVGIAVVGILRLTCYGGGHGIGICRRQYGAYDNRSVGCVIWDQDDQRRRRRRRTLLLLARPPGPIPHVDAAGIGPPCDTSFEYIGPKREFRGMPRRPVVSSIGDVSCVRSPSLSTAGARRLRFSPPVRPPAHPTVRMEPPVSPRIRPVPPDTDIDRPLSRMYNRSSECGADGSGRGE